MHRTFKVNVRDGRFTFAPQQPWVYLPGDTVQWVSVKGNMTVIVGGHPEYPSPFDDYRDDPQKEADRAKELNGRRFVTHQNNDTWETRQVMVQSVFPPRQQLLRRLAAVGSLTYDFTFEVTEEGNGITHFETVRGLGSMC